MDWVSTVAGTVTRRGLLVGGAGVGAALALRARPESVSPRAVPPGRSYPNPAPLTSPADLGSSPVHLLDASPLASYREAHIPGARHVWWQDTMELNSLYYGTVLKPDDGEADQTRRRQLLDRWQIREGAPVVVYDRDDGARAARVAWFLRFLSIETSVLDGGFSGWLALESPDGEVAEPEATAPIAETQPQEGFYLGVRETAEALVAPGVQVVDVRNDGERTGGAMPRMTAPGVVWLPRTLLVGPSRHIVPAPELGALATNAGVDLSSSLVLVGDTGLDTALPWLALTLMGAPQVTICDGGWQQWADLPELPRVTL